MTHAPATTRATRRQHDREIVALAVPAFGALVAEPLFVMADSAIVGHLGTSQLASLAIAEIGHYASQLVYYRRGV